MVWYNGQAIGRARVDRDQAMLLRGLLTAERNRLLGEKSVGSAEERNSINRRLRLLRRTYEELGRAMDDIEETEYGVLDDEE